MQCFDYLALKRGFNKRISDDARYAKLPKEIGQQVLERLRALNIQPERILDIGSGTGPFTVNLSLLYPEAHIYCIDIAEARAQSSPAHAVTADMHALPFLGESFDLVVSNLAWYWADPLDKAIREVRRVLKEKGKFLFSTLGPDTLSELRASFAIASDAPHVNLFLDMHDVGDALFKAGFADPVMDVGYQKYYFKTLPELFAALRKTGEINYQALRSRMLLGKDKLAHIIAHYEQYREGLYLPATLEIIFGYAWRKEEISRQLDSGEVAVPLSQVTSLLPKGRGGEPLPG